MDVTTSVKTNHAMAKSLNHQIPVIDAQGISKVYKMGDIEVRALSDVSVQIYAGELASIMGPSGSGKSTLMNILGCLDQPTTGTYKLDGVDVDRLNDNQLAEIRNRKIGFVFQSFNLLRRTSALENVEQPLIYAGMGMRQRREQAKAALNAVGLGDRIKHHANELSGGQQQRVAIARALVTQPAIILADEPTGNLDSRSGEEIMCLFQRLNEESHITVIFVTHDERIANHTCRIIRIADGHITGNDTVKNQIFACPDGQTVNIPS
jgi:putative ABC transport system ATP-binding protein